MWQLDHKVGWACFWTAVLEKRVPWTARWSNQSILKEISPEYSLEGLMLKLKLQYFGHLIWRADSLGKTLTLEKTEGRRRRERQRMRWLVGWHHQINGHEFEQTPEDSEGRESLVSCSPNEQQWQAVFHLSSLFYRWRNCLEKLSLHTLRITRIWI